MFAGKAKQVSQQLPMSHTVHSHKLYINNVSWIIQPSDAGTKGAGTSRELLPPMPPPKLIPAESPFSDIDKTKENSSTAYRQPQVGNYESFPLLLAN